MFRVLVTDDPLLRERLKGTPLGRIDCRLDLLVAGEDPVRAAKGHALIVLAACAALPDPMPAYQALRAESSLASVPVLLAVSEPVLTLAPIDRTVPWPCAARRFDEALARLLPAAVRRAPRRAVDLPALFVTGGRAHEIRCRDIGIGGTFVAPPGALAVGLSGVFRAPASGPVLSVAAAVVREGEGRGGRLGLGVEFRTEGAEDLIHLARSLQRVVERRRDRVARRGGSA